MSNYKKIYTTIMLIIVVALVTFILTSTFMYKKLGNSSAFSNAKIISSDLTKKIYALKQLINQKYISEVKEEDLIDGAIKGYVAGIGDEYTEYFTKKEMEEFLTETKGNYVGIGIYMFRNVKDNSIVVLTPIEDSPAEKAGIQPGDIIRKVDGIEYTGEDFEKIAVNIKGKENTKVKLIIERDKKELEFEIERKNIELYPIKSEVLENNIGYIKIASFDKDSSKKFKEIYDELNKNNLGSLIIDLRNNGGGIVKEVLKIAEYILEKDQIILTTKDRNGKEEIERSKKNPIIKKPIVVLTNENTASASEILTAALKENKKATVIGETTYGKGVIQELIPLVDGSGIKITIEEYYTPNNNRINKIGIAPDKEVALPEDIENSYKIDRKYDTQLQEAINTLKSK